MVLKIHKKKKGESSDNRMNIRFVSGSYLCSACCKLTRHGYTFVMCYAFLQDSVCAHFHPIRIRTGSVCGPNCTDFIKFSADITLSIQSKSLNYCKNRIEIKANIIIIWYIYNYLVSYFNFVCNLDINDTLYLNHV